MKNIKKYILGILATLMLCITSVVNINNTHNDIVVNAEESSDMVYVGTPINPIGIYDKIYFNTNLSDEEVLNIIKNINFNDELMGAYPIYVVGVGTDYTDIVFNIIYVDDSHYGISIITTEYDDLYAYNMNITTGVNGWRDSYSNVSFNPFTFANNSSGVDSLGGYSLGYDNGYLSQLISSTPFEYVPITDTELKGTPINPTETYDKIYLNTSLSDDEVLSVIEQLDFVSFPYGQTEDYTNYVYAPYILTDFSNSIVILKSVNNNNNNNNVNYMIVSFDNSLEVDDYYWFYNVDFNEYGWEEFDNPITFANIGGTDNFDGASVGQQNDLISSLVSFTPFYRVLKDNPTKNQSMIAGLFGALTTGLTGIMTPIIKGIENGFTDLFVEEYFITNPILNDEKFDLNYYNPNSTVTKICYINYDNFSQLFDSGLINYQNHDLPTYISENPNNRNLNILLNESYILQCYKIRGVDSSSYNFYNYCYLFIDYNGLGFIGITGAINYIWTINNGFNDTLPMKQYINGFNNSLFDGFVLDYNDYSFGEFNHLITEYVAVTSNYFNQSLTPLGIFLIGMFGLVIGFGLIWLIISIFKNRK